MKKRFSRQTEIKEREREMNQRHGASNAQRVEGAKRKSSSQAEKIRDKTNLNNSGRELAEETDLSIQVLTTKAHSAAQDAAKHVTTANVSRHTAIGNGKSQCADVIGNDAVSAVNVVHVLHTQLASVRAASSESAKTVKEWLEQVSVVVGDAVLHNRSHTFQTLRV